MHLATRECNLPIWRRDLIRQQSRLPKVLLMFISRLGCQIVAQMPPWEFNPPRVFLVFLLPPAPLRAPSLQKGYNVREGGGVFLSLLRRRAVYMQAKGLHAFILHPAWIIAGHYIVPYYLPMCPVLIARANPNNKIFIWSYRGSSHWKITRTWHLGAFNLV